MRKRKGNIVGRKSEEGRDEDSERKRDRGDKGKVRKIYRDEESKEKRIM